MADKTYRLSFELSDGSTKEVQLTVPQGEVGPAGPQGTAGRGIVSITGNADGGWTITYTDGSLDTISSEAYAALTAQLTQLSGKNVVLFDGQELTDEQKSQARENIGAQATVGSVDVETLETAAIKYDSTLNDGAGAWVDKNTFEYTETTTYYNYGPTVAKRGTLDGGVLRVSFDTNVVKNFKLCLYLFDGEGNPHKCAGWLEGGTYEKWAGELYEPVYGDPGTITSWGYCSVPFSVQIPSGCTCMCAIQYVPGESSSPDGSLADAQAFQSWVLGGGITFTVEKAFSGYVERDFGEANANRYLVTDENGNVTVGGIVGEEEETSDIPDYLTTEISEVAATLKAVQDAHPKSVTFAFLTDHHFHYNSEHLVRHNLHAIDKISEQCHVEFAAYGGDNIAENGDGVVALRKVKYFGNILRDYNIRKAVAMGNHDDNSLAGYQSDTGKYLVDYAVPQSQFYAHLYRPNENVFNIGMDANRDKLYFYIDLPSQQIRVIFLNVIDIPILDDGNGNLVYTGIHDSGYSNEQLNWVVSDALNFSDKKNPEQWDVIVIQHFVDCPYITDFNSCVTQEHGGEAMYNIFRAFRKREAYSSVISEGDFAHDVSCDFTDAKAGFICSISGHSHADRHVMYDGVLYISTISAGLNGAGVAQGTDGITYYKTPDTAEESGFDFLTFDKDTKTIYATRFGVGVDRVISWESGEVEEEDDGNLFGYGTAADYERYDAVATTDLTVVDGQYVRKADMGSNGALFFNTKTIENPGVAMTLSATFVSEEETLTPIARFGLRLFDADGNILTTGLSSDWKYNATYKAFYQDTDNVTFTLPDTAVSFYVGFLFSVSTVGKYVRVENIMLTAES